VVDAIFERSAVLSTRKVQLPLDNHGIHARGSVPTHQSMCGSYSPVPNHMNGAISLSVHHHTLRSLRRWLLLAKAHCHVATWQ